MKSLVPISAWVMKGRFPFARLEHGDDLRHDEGHQAAHDREAHDAQHDRIEHGRQDFLPHALATLGVVREPLEHAVEVAGLLAGRDGGAINFRKDLRKLGEAVREGVALHDAGSHAHDDTLNARLLGLLRYRQQGLLQGQSGTHQGRELSREQREVSWPRRVVRS